MNLPLELREEFAKYAFPDENYGAKAIEPILPFLETIADLDDDEYRQIKITRDQYGTVKAKSKKLSNIRLNLRKAMLSPLHIVNVPSIIETTMNFDQESFVVLIVEFLVWANVYSNIEITPLEAKILYQFYKNAASGMEGREIFRKDFEVYLQTEIDRQTLNNSLEKLEKLGCIILSAEKIRLVEQIIFVPEYAN